MYDLFQWIMARPECEAANRRVGTLAGRRVLAFVLLAGFASASASNTYTLKDNQWAMISLPADPGGTVSATFADDLPANDYNTSWVLYRFDPAANDYVTVALNSRLEPAVGYWMIQRTGNDVTIDLPASSQPFATTTSSACPDNEGCLETTLAARANQPYTWNLVGYAGRTPSPLADTRIGTVSGTCSTGCAPSAAESEGLLLTPLFHYAGTPANQPYRQVSSASLLNPWEAFWMAVPEAAGIAQARWLQSQGNNGQGNNGELDPDDPAQQDAARLLTQATFGPTATDITRVAGMGPEQWIDEQLTLQGPPHLDTVRRYSNDSNDRVRNETWWQDAVDGPDQLRQRVAFALSQIFVVSDTGYTLSNTQYGITNYYDQLRSGAFGTYRDLLETVTLSPVMGTYLSMRQNSKGDAVANTRPDENFAREVMQLFSIGLYELDQDGRPRIVNGKPVPTYTQDDVESYARVFTGWNYAGATRWNNPFSGPYENEIDPMTPFPGYHDTGAKTLLGGVVSPAGISARADLDNALDSLANHPNVGPFIGRQLIQRLVTSNPTPGYVRRVAQVFANNGQDVRGDLGAVVKAILLDTEARSGYSSVASFGKLREPLLRLSHAWRAFDVAPGTRATRNEYNTIGPQLEDIDSVFGQSVLKAPSVFNFFHPDYSPLGVLRSAGLSAPEAEIYTDDNLLTGTSMVNKQIQYHFASSVDNARKQAYVDLGPEIALGGDPEALLDRLDLLLLSGAMSTGLRSALLDHMAELPDTPAGHSQRARDSIMLVLATPEYLVQK